jgi:hypothetical protein
MKVHCYGTIEHGYETTVEYIVMKQENIVMKLEYIVMKTNGSTPPPLLFTTMMATFVCPSLLVFLTAMQLVVVYISYLSAEGGDSENRLVFFYLSLYKLSTHMSSFHFLFPLLPGRKCIYFPLRNYWFCAGGRSLQRFC